MRALNVILFFVTLLFFSCTSSKIGSYSGADLEVASGVPPKVVENSKTTNATDANFDIGHAVRQAAGTNEEQRSGMEEAKRSLEKETPMLQNNSLMLADAGFQDETQINYEQLTTEMASTLRALAPQVKSRIGRKVLLKTADRVEKKQIEEQQFTFWQKIKNKIAKKIMLRRAKKAIGSDTADILAIVAVSAGAAAWITYYGAFLFGIAGIVLGALALSGGTSRRGMAIAGIALGAVGIFLWLVLFVWVLTIV